MVFIAEAYKSPELDAEVGQTQQSELTIKGTEKYSARNTY